MIERFFKFFTLKSESNAVNIVPITVINANEICIKVNLSLFIKNENNSVYTGYVAINTVETLKLPFDKAQNTNASERIAEITAYNRQLTIPIQCCTEYKTNWNPYNYSKKHIK